MTDNKIHLGGWPGIYICSDKEEDTKKREFSSSSNIPNIYAILKSSKHSRVPKKEKEPELNIVHADKKESVDDFKKLLTQ